MSHTPKAKQPPFSAAAPALTATAVIASFDTLPDSAFVRESQLVRSPKRPGAEVVLPFSAATLWRKIFVGDFPAPVKFGPKISAFHVGSVRTWLNARSVAIRG